MHVAAHDTARVSNDRISGRLGGHCLNSVSVTGVKNLISKGRGATQKIDSNSVLVLGAPFLVRFAT